MRLSNNYDQIILSVAVQNKEKLRETGAALRQWGKENLGNLHKAVQKARKELEEIAVGGGDSGVLKEAKLKLEVYLGRQDEY